MNAIPTDNVNLSARIRDAGERIPVEFPKDRQRDKSGHFSPDVGTLRLVDYGFNTHRADRCRKIAAPPITSYSRGSTQSDEVML